MRLICACGNYTFFECEVEMVQIVTSSPQGLIVQDRDSEGVFDSGGWIRLELQEIVSLTEKDDQSVLRWNASKGEYENGLITCGRCGGRRVSVPYRSWSPPRKDLILEEELHENRQAYSWLRKERERYGHSMPIV